MPAVMTRAERQARTRGGLVDAAERLFIGQGFHATSVEAVAVEAGYTKGAVYSNFESKEDLFFAVYERRVDARVAEIESVLDTAPTVLEGVERAIPGNRGGRETADGWMAVFFEFWAHVLRHPELRERFAAQHRRVIEPLARAMVELARERGEKLPDDPHKLTTARYAMQLGLQLERLTQPEVVDEQLGLRMSRLLDDGGRDGLPDKRLQDFARGARESRALLERERWPRERLERFQRERLHELTRYAAEHSPFWRRRVPRGALRLTDLPVLTKAELMESFDELVTDRRLRLDALLEHLDRVKDDALFLDEYRAMTSSGSSGRKAIFVYDRAGWSGCLAMFLRRSEWVGVQPRLPRRRLAMVWGASPTHMSRRGAQSLDIGVHRLCRLSATQPLPELVARLNAFRPDHLSAYPSIAGPLADEQLAGRLRLQLKGIVTNSEPLTPVLRKRLEEAFGVRPFDFYATTEGLYGTECAEGSMHMFDDMCIVENVDDDGRPVPLGRCGTRLLVTNLFNRAQPLIRFEVTDLMAVEPEPCPCGRSLMRLRALEGRAEEVLSLGGVTVHPLEFAVVTADPDVREFQVVQVGDGLRLRVALRNGADDAPARLRLRVGARLEELGVANPAVEVETVEALERSPAGKLQMIVAGRT